MKKSELNVIITRKIESLDETEHMKEFLYKVLTLEKSNIGSPEDKYIKSFTSSAIDFSKKELDS
ncbi:hypothetical protein [Methanolobus psychrotolerans]|uniref:hypothetical protein n=1 Tax=Methanolobus psychrotolerans TaxID=1874706 RepID=UPI000B91A07F|nr:hypothetical protein [Methanolobus psychrotolerans]